MVDFRSLGHSRKRQKAQSKWRGILGVLITVLLFGVIAAGFFNGLKIKGSFKSSVWDGKSPLAIAVGGSSSMIVFQNEPKGLALLKIPEDVSYASGDAITPIKSLSEGLSDSTDGGRRFLSKYFGVQIPAYMVLKDKGPLEPESSNAMFKEFAFLTTPVFIILNGLDSQIEETNLSRLDLLRLWWQTKGIDVGKFEYISLEKYEIEILGKGDSRFKGLDRDLTRKLLALYLEDSRLIGKNVEIAIINASGENGFGFLASDIAAIAGFDVASVDGGDNISQKTQITVEGKSTEAVYLAKLFDCDIFWRQNDSGETRISLVIGQDFAKTFR